MRYPSYSELIFINGRILKDPAIQAGKKKVRDIDLLLAAAERPRASVFGEDAYPSLKEKAAALLHSIARKMLPKYWRQLSSTESGFRLNASNCSAM